MGTIQYIRLTLVLFLGVIPALFLSMLAGLGFLLGVSSFLSTLSITGLAIAAISCLGLFGAYSILDAAMGASELWQRLGLFADIFAACTFVFFEFWGAGLSVRLEPSYWPLAPIAVAAYLLLESYLKAPRKSEKKALPE